MGRRVSAERVFDALSGVCCHGIDAKNICHCGEYDTDRHTGKRLCTFRGCPLLAAMKGKRGEGKP